MGENAPTAYMSESAVLASRDAAYCLVKSCPVAQFTFQDMVSASAGDCPLDFGSTASTIIILPCLSAFNQDQHQSLSVASRAVVMLREVLQDEAKPIDRAESIDRNCVWYLPFDALLVLARLSRLGFIASQCAVGTDGVHTWTLRCDDTGMLPVTTNSNFGVDYSASVRNGSRQSPRQHAHPTFSTNYSTAEQIYDNSIQGLHHHMSDGGDYIPTLQRTRAMSRRKNYQNDMVNMKSAEHQFNISNNEDAGGEVEEEGMPSDTDSLVRTPVLTPPPQLLLLNERQQQAPTTTTAEAHNGQSQVTDEGRALVGVNLYVHDTSSWQYQAALFSKCMFGRHGAATRIWEFLLCNLCNPQQQHLMNWLDDQGTFVLHRPKDVAAIYGRIVRKKRMTYESLSRSLRNYYTGQNPLLVRSTSYSAKAPFTYKFSSDITLGIGFTLAELRAISIGEQPPPTQIPDVPSVSNPITYALSRQLPLSNWRQKVASRIAEGSDHNLSFEMIEVSAKMLNQALAQSNPEALSSLDIRTDSPFGRRQFHHHSREPSSRNISKRLGGMKTW